MPGYVLSAETRTVDMCADEDGKGLHTLPSSMAWETRNVLYDGITLAALCRDCYLWASQDESNAVLKYRTVKA